MHKTSSPESLLAFSSTPLKLLIIAFREVVRSKNTTFPDADYDLYNCNSHYVNVSQDKENKGILAAYTFTDATRRP